MSKRLKEYLKLLTMIRSMDDDDPRKDSILDRMDDLWWAMSDGDIAMLRGINTLPQEECDP